MEMLNSLIDAQAWMKSGDSLSGSIWKECGKVCETSCERIEGLNACSVKPFRYMAAGRPHLQLFILADINPALWIGNESIINTFAGIIRSARVTPQIPRSADMIQAHLCTSRTHVFIHHTLNTSFQSLLRKHTYQRKVQPLTLSFSSSTASEIMNSIS